MMSTSGLRMIFEAYTYILCDIMYILGMILLNLCGKELVGDMLLPFIVFYEVSLQQDHFHSN